MGTRIVSDALRVWEFVHAYTPVPVNGSMKGLGLERDGALVSGVLYEGWNGHNLWMHVALAPGHRWTPAYLRYCFVYPFEELGCRRVSGYVEASNAAARRVDENLGFRPEATLKGAATDGGDVVLYVMWRDECRFLRGRHGIEKQ